MTCRSPGLYSQNDSGDMAIREVCAEGGRSIRWVDIFIYVTNLYSMLFLHLQSACDAWFFHHWGRGFAIRNEHSTLYFTLIYDGLCMVYASLTIIFVITKIRSTFK